MRSSIESNRIFRGLVKRYRTAGKYLLLSAIVVCILMGTLIPSSEVVGCSGVPSPEMVIFLTSGSGNNITYPEPSAGASSAAGERIYVIDEDTEKTFHVLWNTNGNATIQLSDSVSYQVDPVNIDAQCDWWDGGALVPLASMQNFLQGSGTVGMSMIEDDYSDNEHSKMEFMSEAPAYNSLLEYMPYALNPLKQAVFAIVPDNNSNNPQWRSAGNEDRGYHSSVGQYPRLPVGDQNPLQAVYTDPETGELNPRTPLVEFQTLMVSGPDGQKDNADDNFRILRYTKDSYGAIDETQILPFCNPEDPYTVPDDDDVENFCSFVPDSSVISPSNLWEGLPTSPKTSGTDGTDATQRMVVVGSKYRTDTDPKWSFMGMGVTLDIDPTNIIGSSGEQSLTDMNSGEISCKFTVPTEPFFLETEISVVFLFYLKDAVYEWYELIQTWDGDSWTPSTLPTLGGDLTRLNTGALNGADYVDCVKGPYSASVKGYMLRPAENPENQAKTLISVRDNTPPAFAAIRTDDTEGANKFTMTPPALTATTGDTLAQNGANPEFIEVTIFDNNPYAPFQLMYTEATGEVPDNLRPDTIPDDGLPLKYGEGNLNLQLFYNTELYDYTKVDKTDSNLPDDTNMAANLFNRRMTWAKAAFGGGLRDSMNVINDISNMDYEIYDEQCNPISDQMRARMNAGGDPQKITVGPQQPAFSTVTFKVPVASFLEPMPLHASDNSKALEGKSLKWFPLIADASNNLAPYGGNTFNNFGSELHDLNIQDPTEEGFRSNFMPDYSAPDEANILGQTTVELSSQQDTADELLLSGYVEANWYKLFDGTDPSETAGKFGEMGIINVEDDEPPQIFIYVTDTKYNKTYRYGIQKEGDSTRTAMMKENYVAETFDGWCDKNQELTSGSSLSTNGLNYGLRSYDLTNAFIDPLTRHATLNDPILATSDFESEQEIVFGDKFFENYDDYIDKAVTNDTFNPSAGYPADLPGCWVDEDTRLLFHVVAYDNCSTYDKGGSSSASDQMSIFDKKVGGEGSYGNGIASLEWKINDNGQEFTNEYMDDYVFRNPTVNDEFDLTGEECSVEVTAEDSSGNSRTMRILFYVMSNNMKFRSIEEKSGRGSKNSWF